MSEEPASISPHGFLLRTLPQSLPAASSFGLRLSLLPRRSPLDFTSASGIYASVGIGPPVGLDPSRRPRPLASASAPRSQGGEDAKTITAKLSFPPPFLSPPSLCFKLQAASLILSFSHPLTSIMTRESGGGGEEQANSGGQHPTPCLYGYGFRTISVLSVASQSSPLGLRIGPPASASAFHGVSSKLHDMNSILIPSSHLIGPGPPLALCMRSRRI